MVEKVVVDTSFLIELLDRGRKELSKYILENQVLIPFPVVYEYLYGYMRLNWDIEKAKKILDSLGDIVWPDQEQIMKTLEIDVELSSRGINIPEADLIIAATALKYQAPLLTFDKRHYTIFENLGLKVIIP